MYLYVGCVIVHKYMYIRTKDTDAIWTFYVKRFYSSYKQWTIQIPIQFPYSFNFNSITFNFSAHRLSPNILYSKILLFTNFHRKCNGFAFNKCARASLSHMNDDLWIAFHDGKAINIHTRTLIQFSHVIHILRCNNAVCWLLYLAWRAQTSLPQFATAHTLHIMSYLYMYIFFSCGIAHMYQWFSDMHSLSLVGIQEGVNCLLEDSIHFTRKQNV